MEEQNSLSKYNTHSIYKDVAKDYPGNKNILWTVPTFEKLLGLFIYITKYYDYPRLIKPRKKIILWIDIVPVFMHKHDYAPFNLKTTRSPKCIYINLFTYT